MFKKILIIQTAFLGDVILTLPLVQVLKKYFPDSQIDFLCIPSTSILLKNNPYINEVYPYDKKNSGINGLISLVKKIRKIRYELILSPHRSFRSSLISYFSSASKSVSFDTTSFSFLYSDNIVYDRGIHEIQRNLKLLEPIGISQTEIVRPEIFVSEQERRKVNSIFYEHRFKPDEKFIVIAPGSAWFTKRFPEEKFITLCNLLITLNLKIFLIGGKEDKKTSDFILYNSRNKNLINVTGNLSVLESTELISKAELIITNDSAPLHIANSVDTKVIALFGSTVPEFGFYPYGNNDIVIATEGLSCRPCSLHGKNKCPVGTFVCMKNINEGKIVSEIKKMLG
ncbi:MAG: glycosyltransferase family 9 protein [Ignavibacteria bacterium]